MNVATALNRKYLLYTGVMLSSLCENNPVHVDAYLLHGELLDTDIGYLQTGLSKYDITIHSMRIDKAAFSEKLGTNSMWTIETYFRLMLLDILPENVDRIFYFDVDLIINKSLKDFYEVDFGDKEIIACEDDCGMCDLSHYGPVHRKMFGREEMKDYRYFNAGVLLLNVREMRKKYDFKYYMNVAKEDWNYEMEAFDQDLLNYVHWKNVGYMPFEKYDLFARIAFYSGVKVQTIRENVAIIHYTQFKPWDGCATHFDIEQIWWDYARKTPFYDELAWDYIYQSISKKNDEGKMLEGLLRDK